MKLLYGALCSLMLVTSAQARGLWGCEVRRCAMLFSTMTYECYNKKSLARVRQSLLNTALNFCYSTPHEFTELKEELRIYPMVDEVYTILDDASAQIELQRVTERMSVSPPLVPDVGSSSDDSLGSPATSPVTIPDAGKKQPRRVSFSPNNQVFHLNPEDS